MTGTRTIWIGPALRFVCDKYPQDHSETTDTKYLCGWMDDHYCVGRIT